jgi:putative hydrolase of the HAD superfamily
MTSITTIGFDADDTLWHCEQVFKDTQDWLIDLLADYVEGGHLAERLLEAERRNINHYGYGAKSFTFSMMETAMDVTADRVPASVLRKIMEVGRDMLTHPVELLPEVEKTVKGLSLDYKIVLITKGDLFDQERKLAQSGLGDYFDAVEIVSEKDTETYRTVFARHGDGAARAVMVGNSLKSDIVPAIEAGSWGIHVPHDVEWELEYAEAPTGADRFRTTDNLAGAAEFIRSLS